MPFPIIVNPTLHERSEARRKRERPWRDPPPPKGSKPKPWPPQAIKPFPFFRLPYEIQVLICSYAVISPEALNCRCLTWCEPTITPSRCYRPADEKILHQDYQSHILALARALPSLQSEISNAWFSENEFLFIGPHDLVDFVSLVGEANAARVRRVSLTSSFYSKTYHRLRPSNRREGRHRFQGCNRRWFKFEQFTGLQTITQHCHDRGPADSQTEISRNYAWLDYCTALCVEIPSLRRIRFELSHEESGPVKYEVEESTMVAWIECDEELWNRILRPRWKNPALDLKHDPSWTAGRMAGRTAGRKVGPETLFPGLQVYRNFG